MRYDRVTSSSLERNGGHEGQANPFLLWCRLPSGLEDDYRTIATGQTRDAEGPAKSELTQPRLAGCCAACACPMGSLAICLTQGWSRKGAGIVPNSAYRPSSGRIQLEKSTPEDASRT